MRTLILGLTALAMLTVNPSAMAGVYWDDGQSHTIVDDTYQDDGFYLDYYTNNIPGTQAYLVDGGSVGGLSAWHNSIFTMTGGSVARHLRAWHNAILTMSGGSVGWYLDANDNATITLSGGTVGTVLQTVKNGTIYLYGRVFQITDLDGNTTRLFSEDKLSDFGTLVEDGSGTWISDYYTGTISGILEDGTLLNNQFKIYNTGSLEGTGDIIIKHQPKAYRPVLVALSQEDETGLLLKGSPTLTVITEDTDTRSDLFTIYSSAQDALLVQGNATISASKLNISGGINIKGSLSYPDDMVISENLGDIGGLPPGLFEHFEPDYTGLPDRCPVDPVTGKTSPVVITGGEWVLEPGYYSAGIIVKGASVSLTPGIYHLGGGMKDNSGLIIKGDGVVDANEVMFHMIGTGGVSIDNDAMLTATAPVGDDYGGFLFFQSPQNTSEAVFKGVADCSGVLYFPVNHVEVTGNVLCSILMANTIELSGEAELTVNPNYPPYE